jgi:hypothetical protein
MRLPKDLQRKIKFDHVAEAFTSQICNQCKTKNLTKTIIARSK